MPSGAKKRKAAKKKKEIESSNNSPQQQGSLSHLSLCMHHSFVSVLFP
jgi:hypothetical protein